MMLSVDPDARTSNASSDSSSSSLSPTCNPNAICPEITEDAACEYNKDKAQQCLDGEYTCQEITDSNGNTSKTVVPPAECGQVCGGGGG